MRAGQPRSIQSPWRPRRTLPAVAYAAALLSAPATARADGDVTASLAWVRARGAESCADAGAVRAMVDARVGRPLIVAAGTVSIEVVVSGDAAGGAASRWRAEIYVRDGSGALVGERELTSSADDCGPLAESVALAVAVTLDADAALRTVAASPAATPAPPPAAPRPPPAANAAAPRVRPRRPRRTGLAWSFGARGAVGLGVLPGVAAGAGLGADVTRPDGLRVAAAVWYWPERLESTPALGGATVLRLVGALLSVCPALVQSTHFLVGLCAGTFAGVLTAAGHGYGYDAQADRPYWSLDAGASARWLAGPVYLEVLLEAVLPLVRDRFVVDGYRQVYAQPAAAVRAGFGAGLHFR